MERIKAIRTGELQRLDKALCEYIADGYYLWQAEDQSEAVEIPCRIGYIETSNMYVASHIFIKAVIVGEWHEVAQTIDLSESSTWEAEDIEKEVA